MAERDPRSAAPPGIRLRPARPEDATAMRALARAAYARYLPRMDREPAPMNDDYPVAIGTGGAWIAERTGRPAGLLILAPQPDHLLVENLAVAPDQQRAGIGTALLGLAERQARALGLTEIRLYTNEAMTENLEYYPRHGYRETHRGGQDGYRRVFFSKRLAG